jgi:hypothetical protein
VWCITATSNSGPSGSTFFGDLAYEGHVIDHLGGHPAADVPDDQGVAQAQAEDVCGIHARVEARDHEEVEVGEYDGAFVAAGGGEGAVAFEHLGAHERIS